MKDVAIIHADKRTKPFLQNLAQNFDVVVEGKHQGCRITYQFSTERFLKEFFHAPFAVGRDNDIVESFFYKGERVVNFKIFPYTFGTEKETIYDVVGYLKKQEYLERNKSMKKVEVSPRQMDIFDFIS